MLKAGCFLAPFGTLGQSGDDLSQREKGLVDVYRLLLGKACSPSGTLPLTTGQVDKLELAHNTVVH